MRVLMRPDSTIAVASIDCASVTRRPSIICVGTPSFSVTSVSCGPPPCTNTTRMPSECSTAICSTSARVAAGSPNTPPPAFTTKVLPLKRRM